QFLQAAGLIERSAHAAALAWAVGRLRDGKTLGDADANVDRLGGAGAAADDDVLDGEGNADGGERRSKGHDDLVAAVGDVFPTGLVGERVEHGALKPRLGA